MGEVSRTVKMTVLYRVTSWRTTTGRPERVTQLRRQWPAAQRLADLREENGHGPVAIEVAVIPAHQWREVGR